MQSIMKQNADLLQRFIPPPPPIARTLRAEEKP